MFGCRLTIGGIDTPGSEVMGGIPWLGLAFDCPWWLANSWRKSPSPDSQLQVVVLTRMLLEVEWCRATRRYDLIQRWVGHLVHHPLDHIPLHVGKIRAVPITVLPLTSLHSLDSQLAVHCGSCFVEWIAT